MERLHSEQSEEIKNEILDMRPEAKALRAIEEESAELEALTEKKPAPEGKEAHEWQRNRKWKKAALHALTFMAFSGVGIETRAQNQILPQKDGTALIETTGENDPKKVEANGKKAEKLRLLIEDKKFKERVARLIGTYGETINFLRVEIVENEWDLEELKTATGNRRNYLLTKLAGSYDYYWNKKEIVKHAEKFTEMPGVSGFELAGHSNQKVEAILKEYPADLLTNIDEVRYVDAVENAVAPPAPESGEKKESVVYGVAGRAYNVGIQSVLWHGRGYEHSNVLTIYKASGEKPHTESQLRDLLAHEILHYYDWETSPRLTTGERFEMLDEQTEYLDNPKRRKSHYTDELVPEEYKKNHWDEKAMRLRQAKELWAEEFEDFSGGFTTARYETMKRNIMNGKLEDFSGVKFSDKWLNNMQIGDYVKATNLVRDNQSGRPSMHGVRR